MTISLAAEKIFEIGGFPVTNSLLTSWLVMAFLVILSVFVALRIKLVPGGLQNVVEFMVESLLNLVVSVSGHNGRRFFGFVATFFFFILFSNWAGLLPGVGSVGFWEEAEGHRLFIPFLRAGTSDLNTTLALALIAMVAIHSLGLKDLGLFKYVAKYIKNPIKDPMGAIVGFLEIILEFAKILSFSFRLFGNVFAGEVLLIVVAFLVPVFVPFPFLGLEIFVGFIQALVFMLLTLIFINMAVAKTH